MRGGISDQRGHLGYETKVAVKEPQPCENISTGPNYPLPL